MPDKQTPQPLLSGEELENQIDQQLVVWFHSFSTTPKVVVLGAHQYEFFQEYLQQRYGVHPQQATYWPSFPGRYGEVELFKDFREEDRVSVFG
jgi:hypothetical protein